MFLKKIDKPKRRYSVGAANATTHADIHVPNAALQAKIAAGVPTPAKNCGNNLKRRKLNFNT